MGPHNFNSWDMRCVNCGIGAEMVANARGQCPGKSEGEQNGLSRQGAKSLHSGAYITATEQYRAQLTEQKIKQTELLFRQQLAQQQYDYELYKRYIPNTTKIAPDPKPESIKRTGIVCGERLGWRAWKLGAVSGERYLVSWSQNTNWPYDRPFEGFGLKPGNETGIYAFKEQSAAHNHVSKSDKMVLGTVYLWGEIIEHELGYRAEFARVASLYAVLGVPPPEERLILNSLRTAYLADQEAA